MYVHYRVVVHALLLKAFRNCNVRAQVIIRRHVTRHGQSALDIS
ncbi:hypothetical protein [Kibdelosporangium aridum]